MKLKIKEITVLAILGSIMCASDYLMDLLPNVHLIGVFIVAITVVFRFKALWAIYTYVFLLGLTSGFSLWWISYLYVWIFLWGAVMLLPKNMPKKIAPIVYMIICALHGYLFGALCAPCQALLFGYDFNQMVAWIVAGFPFDLIHGTSNLICGILIFPLIKVLKKATA